MAVNVLKPAISIIRVGRAKAVKAALHKLLTSSLHRHHHYNKRYEHGFSNNYD